MAEKPPVGAIPEDELANLRSLYYDKTSPPGYYLVTEGGTFSRNANYAFSSPPPAYYFTNYFHAWAYHLKLLRGRDHEK